MCMYGMFTSKAVHKTMRLTENWSYDTHVVIGGFSVGKFVQLSFSTFCSKQSKSNPHFK